MTHLLVTNDFPPKTGGIQTLLWELWRRLPTDDFAVLTTPHSDAAAWDAAQGFRIERVSDPVLLPHSGTVRRIDALAAEIGADLVVLDPALPLGLVGPRLERPYAVVLHGAEVTVPGRLPGTDLLLRRVLRGAERIVAFGTYPAAEARRAARAPLTVDVIPCGIDVSRFQPLDAAQRAEVRRAHGFGDGPLIFGLSRLVPRKGFDVLIEAAARLDLADLQIAIGGTGRDRDRLEHLASDLDVPVRFLGRVSDDDLPGLYGCADLYVMLCRNRWAGLEQEGFGIVFLEAAASGTPQVAGRSGGAADAVVDGVTGAVIDDPRDVDAVAACLASLLADPERRAAMGHAGRARTVADFDYDRLADRLQRALEPRPIAR